MASISKALSNDFKSNVKLIEGVSNEDVKYLCDFMGIDAVRHGDDRYSWSDGFFFSVVERDYHKCMVSVWRYIWERKLGDWNFVMSVVHKCLAICHEEMLNEWENGFCNSFMSMDISVMVKECMSFVKWYIDNKDRG